jgi:hypothetical protein
MFRVVFFSALILFCSTHINAESVSLSGTVKKTGGTTGISGVKVSLVKATTLSATTDASGAFSLTGSTTAVHFSKDAAPARRFSVNGAMIAFTAPANNPNGKIEIFSSNGRKKISIDLNSMPSGTEAVALPELASGINMLRITMGSESITRTLMRVGGNLYVKSDRSEAIRDRNFVLAKSLPAEAKDTLVAAKDGYATKKLAIDSYNKQNIAITLDSAGGAPGACTREALQAAADSYVEAQKAGDPSKMPLAAQVKYTQNMKDITADKTICKTALPTIASRRDIFDVDSCRSFTELIITEGSHPYVIGTRLRVDNGKISEVSSMVTDKGDWGFDAAKYLSNSKDENWDVLAADKRTTRQALINAGNAYFDLIFDWTKDTVPWGDGCYRIEGGSMVAKPCTGGTTGNSVKTTCRTYVVDVDKGSVNLYCYFGYGPDSHTFRLVSGKVVYIHTLTACGDTVAAGKDCWGTAAKGKAKGYCDWYSH